MTRQEGNRNHEVLAVDAAVRTPFRPILVLLAIVLSFISCYETAPPVAESIEIRFLPKQGAFVKVVVKISNPKKSFEESAVARERIEQTQRELLEGRDPWTRRFNDLAFAREIYSWEKEEGELAVVTHSGMMANPEHLRDFFRDTLIDVNYVSEDESAELAVYPLKGSRATRRQQEILEEGMQPWIANLASYFAAVEKLYRYVEVHPDRAKACFEVLFKDVLSPERAKNMIGTTDEEDGLLQPLMDSMTEIVKILEYESDSAYSLNEIARLEYDPFPAPISIEVPGEILAVEGFEVRDGNRVIYAGTSLWDAFRKLEGKFHSPDPLLLLFPYYSGEKNKDEPFDLQAFLNRPRRTATPPSPQQVKEDVAAALTPYGVYRVQWKARDMESERERGEQANP